MKLITAIAFICATSPAFAEILVPVRTIRAREIISAEDVTFSNASVVGAITDPADIVGQEARVALYPGRPVRPGDIGAPALIDRNDTVTLIYLQGRLRIIAEGRALGRGAEGEIIRAMNNSSRATVSGRILANGSIEVR